MTLEECHAVLLSPGGFQISSIIIPPLTGQPYSIGDLKKIAGYVMQGESEQGTVHAEELAQRSLQQQMDRV